MGTVIRCLMDVNDEHNARRDPSTFRRMGCDHDVDPVRPKHDSGCRCPECGAVCTECPGFGWSVRPTPKFHDIVARVRVMIRATTKKRGAPPDLVRLSQEEIDVIVAKWHEEDDDHFVKMYVDVGPPVRIFDYPVIAETRGDE